MNDMTDFKGGVPSLAISEEELIEVLGSSFYPGAKLGSIKLVLNYCKAIAIDPMQKPVHIVPMSVTVGKNDEGYDKKEMRDVVMPGIGLYRIQASRTGEYVGLSEPTFGPMKCMSFTKTAWQNKKPINVDSEVEYPEWCEMTVIRNVRGTLARFTAREYWLENYASKGDGGAPNSMWAKRPMGQIAKCAEAQALRKGFPEVGSQPTAEEMEGKSLDSVPESLLIEGDGGGAGKRGPETYPTEKFEENLPKWRQVIESGKKTPDDIINMVNSKQPLTEAQKTTIRAITKKTSEFDVLAKRLQEAKDMDALGEAADLIGSMTSDDDQTKLHAIYQQRAAELKDA